MDKSDVRVSGALIALLYIETICAYSAGSWSGGTNVDYTFYIYFRPQTSDYKPQALRESSRRQKKPETKPAGEVPLFDQLKTKVKETSRKLQVLFLFVLLVSVVEIFLHEL